MTLTHGRVKNNFRSGTEHIKKSSGTEILRRSLRPLPRCRFNAGGFFGGLINRSYHRWNRKTLALYSRGTRKHALTVGTVGTSAAIKRVWAKRSKYTK